MGRRGWEPAQAKVKARRASSKFALGQDTDVSLAKRYEYVVHDLELAELVEAEERSRDNR
jgi:hypothetical protein